MNAQEMEQHTRKWIQSPAGREYMDQAPDADLLEEWAEHHAERNTPRHPDQTSYSSPAVDQTIAARWGRGHPSADAAPAPKPPPWPPTCPNCDAPMRVKRRQVDGSGTPFWSCSRFPHCSGNRPFEPSDEDLLVEGGNERRALFAALERARDRDLIDTASGAQHRAHRRHLANARIDALRKSSREPGP